MITRLVTRVGQLSITQDEPARANFTPRFFVLDEFAHELAQLPTLEEARYYAAEREARR